MSRSLAEVKQEQKELYKTVGQIKADFKRGDRVKVIVPCQDFHFFNGETGKVVAIEPDSYLCIKVKFDKERHYENGMILKDFHFEPEDLVTFKNYKKLFEKW